MNNGIAISAENLSKVYQVQFRRKGVLLRDLLAGYFLPWPKPHAAVEGLSFELPRGKALGVIGPNGSGKTTLLKLLCGLSPLTGGTVRCSGRVLGMLGLGAGLQPVLTGWQNIRLCCLVYGLSPEQVDAREQQIAEFSDLGRFLDAPVKTYSSGMVLRLGFACAIHADPEILLIDEVISVGDREFQARCFERIEALQAQGVSMVLATHNPQIVRDYCDQLLHLEQGRMVKWIKGRLAIAYYLDQLFEGGEDVHLRDRLEQQLAREDKGDPVRALEAGVALLRDDLPTLNPGQREARLVSIIDTLDAAARAQPERRLALLRAFARGLLELIELLDGVTLLRIWEPWRTLLKAHLPGAGTISERLELLIELSDLLYLEPGPIKITLNELGDVLRAQLAALITSGDPAAEPAHQALLSRLDGHLAEQFAGQLQLRLIAPQDGHLQSGEDFSIAVEHDWPAGQSLMLELALHDTAGHRVAVSAARIEIQPGQLRYRCAALHCPPGVYRIIVGAGPFPRVLQYGSVPLEVGGQAEAPLQLSGAWVWSD